MTAVTIDNLNKLEEVLKGEQYNIEYNVPAVHFFWNGTGTLPMVISITKNNRISYAIDGDCIEKVETEIRINPVTKEDYIRKGFRIYALSDSIGLSSIPKMQDILFNDYGLRSQVDRIKNLLYVY